MVTASNQPDRVLVYSLSWLPGQVDGIAVRMLAHVKELVARGIEVILVTPNYVDGQAGQPPEFVRVPGVKHVLLDTMPMPVYEKNRCAALSFKNAHTVLELIRATRPALVHATQCASLSVFFYACTRADVPMLVSMHTDVSQIIARDGGFSSGLSGVHARVLSYLANSVTNLAYRVMAGLGIMYFPVSKQAKSILTNAGVGERNIVPQTWGPMVDRRTFRIELPEEQVAETRRRLTFGLEGAYLMVYVGRVTAEKDVGFLVDALARAPPNVVLALVGSGSLVPELKPLHGPERRLHCTGDFVGREEVAIAMRAADCCVSASTMETVGFTAMEALSCGTPMLAADAQGFSEHLSHGVNARLFKPGDEASFDRELAAIMATPREGAWSAQALRDSMEHASLSTCTERALQAYEYVRGPRRSAFGLVWTFAVFLFNVVLFQVPAVFRALQPRSCQPGAGHQA